MDRPPEQGSVYDNGATSWREEQQQQLHSQQYPSTNYPPPPPLPQIGNPIQQQPSGGYMQQQVPPQPPGGIGNPYLPQQPQPPAAVPYQPRNYPPPPISTNMYNNLPSGQYQQPPLIPPASSYAAPYPTSASPNNQPYHRYPAADSQQFVMQPQGSMPGHVPQHRYQFGDSGASNGSGAIQYNPTSAPLYPSGPDTRASGQPSQRPNSSMAMQYGYDTYMASGGVNVDSTEGPLKGYGQQSIGGAGERGPGLPLPTSSQLPQPGQNPPVPQSGQADASTARQSNFLLANILPPQLQYPSRGVDGTPSPSSMLPTPFPSAAARKSSSASPSPFQSFQALPPTYPSTQQSQGQQSQGQQSHYQQVPRRRSEPSKDNRYRSTPDSGDGHGDGASEATGSEDSHNTAKANLSRHVTSVISHFTATEEGYRRLLNELDDFLHVVTPSGTIVYCSPSVKRFLGYTGNDLAGHHVSEILHREDRAPLLRTLQSQDLSGGDGTSASSATGISVPPSCTMYLRYQKKAGDFVLLEVRGKQLMDDKHIKSLTNGPGAANAASSVGTARCVVLTAREYRSKASLAVDSLLEYRIENLRLRRQLSVELRERGIDPGTHPLLRVGPPSPRIPHPHDPESFEPFNDLETGRPVGDQQAGSLSDNAGMKDKASYRGDKDQSLSSSSLVAVSDINIGVKEKSEPSAPPKRKRKAPRSEELFCRQCGTTSSPEWRKGPDGPKTLCNACGLAYSKKQRKFNIADTGGGPAAGTNGAGGGSSVAAGRASGDSAITNHSSKAGPKLGSATSTALIPDTPVPQGKNA